MLVDYDFIWEKYSDKREDFSIEKYYHELFLYLKKVRGWWIGPLQDSENYVVTEGMVGIYCEGGRVGKIQRLFDKKTKTLTLEHLSVVFDDEGNRKKGIGLTKLIYGFEATLPKIFKIDRICVEPVSSIIKKEFIRVYGDENINKRGNIWCVNFA